MGAGCSGFGHMLHSTSMVLLVDVNGKSRRSLLAGDAFVGLCACQPLISVAAVLQYKRYAAHCLALSITMPNVLRGFDRFPLILGGILIDFAIALPWNSENNDTVNQPEHAM